MARVLHVINGVHERDRAVLRWGCLTCLPQHPQRDICYIVYRHIWRRAVVWHVCWWVLPSGSQQPIVGRGIGWPRWSASPGLCQQRGSQSKVCGTFRTQDLRLPRRPSNYIWRDGSGSCESRADTCCVACETFHIVASYVSDDRF